MLSGHFYFQSVHWKFVKLKRLHTRERIKLYKQVYISLEFTLLSTVYKNFILLFLIIHLFTPGSLKTRHLP